MVVRQYLAEKFRFDDSKIKTLGMGEGGESGADNRVTILIYPDGKDHLIEARGKK